MKPEVLKWIRLNRLAKRFNQGIAKISGVRIPPIYK